MKKIILILISIFTIGFCSCEDPIENLDGWIADDISKDMSLRTLKGHSKSVRSVCWSPDGKYLASGSADNTVIIWGVE